MAPPIRRACPALRVRRGAPRSAAIASSAVRERVVGDDAVEAETLGEARRADVEAEALVDLLAPAERELRAAAAGVEHDERAAAERRARTSRRGRRAGPPPRRGSPRRSTPQRSRTASTSTARLRRCRSPAVADRGDRRDAAARRLVDHAAIASTVRSIGSGCSLPVSSRPSPSRVTSARSTTVRHAPSAVPLADVELDRVRADVDDRVALRARTRASALSPRGEARRSADRAEAELAHGRDHARRDPPTRPRSCASSAPSVRDLGQLGHAAADRVVPRRLCTSTSARRRLGSTSSATSCSSVYGSRASAGAAERRAPPAPRATSVRGEREGRLQDRASTARARRRSRPGAA